MVLDVLIKALFVSYGVICLLCLRLLTSPKSNATMVNWLADFRSDLDYAVTDKILKKAATSMACARPANYSILLASVMFASLYHPLYFINLLQSSSADGIAVVAVCCQSMSSVQYACNSTEASAPMVLHFQ